MSRHATLFIGIIVGTLAGWLLHGTSSHAQTAAGGAAAGNAAGGPLVRLDETKMAVSYVNAYRIHTAAEEVIVDVGFNMPNPNAAADPKSGELLFSVSNRLVLTYTNAKRLQMSLQTLIARYEKQFGELPLAPAAATQPGQ